MSNPSALEKYRFGSYDLMHPQKTASRCGVCEEGKRLYVFPLNNTDSARVCASCVKKAVTAKSVPPYSLLHFVRNLAQSMQQPELLVKVDIHDFAYNYAKFVILCSQQSQPDIKREADRILFSGSVSVVKESMLLRNLERVVRQFDSNLAKFIGREEIDEKLNKITATKQFSKTLLREASLDVALQRILHIFSSYVSKVKNNQQAPLVCKNCGKVVNGMVKTNSRGFVSCNDRTCKTFKNSLELVLSADGSVVYRQNEELAGHNNKVGKQAKTRK